MITTRIRPGMHVTLRQLKVFQAVARQLSFTRAADVLSLSQSTVSTQVKQLADIVGQPLLEQTGRRLRLTEIGLDLERTCDEMFSAWDRFEATAGDMRRLEKGCLRLACITAAGSFLPRLLTGFRDRYPAIEVRLEVAPRERIMERLARGEDDLYVMTQPPRQFDIAAHPFLDNPLIAVAAEGHALAGKRRISLARLAREPWLLRERGSGTRLATERHLREHGIELTAKVEIDSDEAILRAVAAGQGVTILAQSALEAMGGRVAVLDVDALPIPCAWHVVHPGRQLSVVARTFLGYLEQEAVRRFPTRVEPTVTKLAARA